MAPLANFLMNHCVNDIAVQGATPLLFLDNDATGRLEPTVSAAVVRDFTSGAQSGFGRRFLA